jgi:hypothetical protein
MRIDWRTGIMLALVIALAGCGSYSAPNNTSMSPDSTGDTTRTPPPNYSRN